MRDKLGDEIRIQHILDAIAEIENYTIGVTLEVFVENSMMKFAVVKPLDIIGEAASRLSDGLKGEFEEVSWSKIIAARNIFVHEYFGIDDKILWDIVTLDLPIFKSRLQRMLQ